MAIDEKLHGFYPTEWIEEEEKPKKIPKYLKDLAKSQSHRDMGISLKEWSELRGYRKDTNYDKIMGNHQAEVDEAEEANETYEENAYEPNEKKGNYDSLTNQITNQTMKSWTETNHKYSQTTLIQSLKKAMQSNKIPISKRQKCENILNIFQYQKRLYEADRKYMEKLLKALE